RQRAGLSELRKSFQQHRAIQITHTQPPARQKEIGVNFQCFFKALDGFVVLAQHKMRKSHGTVDGRREGIELARLLCGLERVLESALWDQARNAVALV